MLKRKQDTQKVKIWHSGSMTINSGANPRAQMCATPWCCPQVVEVCISKDEMSQVTPIRGTIAITLGLLALLEMTIYVTTS